MIAGATEDDYAKKVTSRRTISWRSRMRLRSSKPSRLVVLTPSSRCRSSAQLMAQNNTDVVEVAAPFTSQFSTSEGIAFREDDVELRTAFNKHLAACFGTPEFMSIMEPVGFTKDKLPGDTTRRPKSAPSWTIEPVRAAETSRPAARTSC